MALVAPVTMATFPFKPRMDLSLFCKCAPQQRLRVSRRNHEVGCGRRCYRHRAIARWLKSDQFTNGITPVPVFRSRRSEEHTSELQSLMRISYAVFCLQ